MDLGLSNKVAVVTGGSQGIGKYAAMRMAQEGARVIIVARTQETLDPGRIRNKNFDRRNRITFSCRHI